MFSQQIAKQIILLMILRINVLQYVHILNLPLDRLLQKDVFQLVRKDNLLIQQLEDVQHPAMQQQDFMLILQQKLVFQCVHQFLTYTLIL